MPTKSRNHSSSFPRSIRNERGEVLVSDVLSYSDLAESISSLNTYRRGTSDCLHSRTVCELASNSHLYYGGTSGTSTWCRSTPTAFGVESLTGDIDLHSIDLRALHAEAFRTMRPGMESGFSGSNFLLELGDMKNLFRLWERAQGVLKNISNGILNYHYGWKTTVRDGLEIYNRLMSFSERLRSLIKNQGSPQKRHFSKVLEKERATADLPVYLWGGDRVQYVYTYILPLRYTATMNYRYYLPEMSEAALRARALADHFGLKVNASIIWEAIPFSFVIDWFVRVGDFLSQFDQSWVEPKVEILDFCYSLKYELACNVSCRRNVSNPNNSTWFLSHTVTRKYYERRRTLPNPYYWCSLDTNDKSWNVSRYLIAGSLLHQRWG